jgi:Na+/proline symporter
MHALDWVLVICLPILVIWDGVRRGAQAKDLEGFLLAGRSVRWWAIGLSVMATQASAITMISISGHGYEHGLRWLHVYLALPFAMVILCATVVPWFTRARVFTAYEYLERRFDGTTRTLASVVFLVSRGLAVGTSVYTTAIILNLVLGVPQAAAILAIGGIASAYTVFGGNAAVIFTDVKQMLVMFLGIGASLWIVVARLPESVGFADALALAGASNRLEGIHVAPDAQHVLADRYNLVAGLVGGLFLYLGYFGADQSQVQRYLAGKSTDHSRASLLVSAFLKVPMQFAILLLGALIFVFYMFVPAPVFFRAAALDHAAASAPADVRAQWQGLQARHEQAAAARRAAAEAFVHGRADAARAPALAADLRARNGEVAKLKREANALHQQLTGAQGGDNDFVFPHFFLNELPVGLLGLVIAAIFIAAMSSLDAQLNSLATSSVLDLYARFRQETSPTHVLRLSRIATFFWGAFATASAFFVARLGQMIEAVNVIGSFFYGVLFGTFLLAWVCPPARGRVGWISLLGGLACVTATQLAFNREKVLIDGRWTEPVGFLWFNVIGALGVLATGVGATGIAALRARRRSPPAGPRPSGARRGS